MKLLKIISEIKQLNVIPFNLPNNLDKEYDRDMSPPGWWNLIENMQKELARLNPQIPSEFFKWGEFSEDLGDDLSRTDPNYIWNKNTITYGDIIKSYLYWLPYYCFNHYNDGDEFITTPFDQFRKFQSMAIKGRWIVYDYTDPNRTENPITEIKQSQIFDLDKPGTDPFKIQVGDILIFTLPQNGPFPSEKVKQKVIEIVPEKEWMKTKDLGANGNDDYWTFVAIINYHNQNETN